MHLITQPNDASTPFAVLSPAPQPATPLDRHVTPLICPLVPLSSPVCHEISNIGTAGSNPRPSGDLIANHGFSTRDAAIRQIAGDDSWRVQNATTLAFTYLHSNGVDLQNDLVVDQGGHLDLRNDKIPDLNYKVVDAHFCNDANDSTFYKNHFYRVPLTFCPHTLLSGIGRFDKRDFLRRVDPHSNSPDFWKEQFKKLEDYSPAEWLEGQLLKTLLYVLDIICTQMYFDNCFWNDGGKGLFYYTGINHKLFKENCPRVDRKSRRYYHAILLLSALGVIRLNPRYCMGDDDRAAFPKSFRMGEAYLQPVYKYLALKRHSDLSSVEPTLPEGTVERYIQDQLPRVEVDASDLRRLLADTADPRRHFRLIEAWRGLLTNPYVERGKKGDRLYHPLTNCPKEFRSCLRIDGERLWDVDIDQCQAMLLYTHVRDNGFCDEGELIDFRHLLLDGDLDAYSTLSGSEERLEGERRKRVKKQFYQYAFSGIGDSPLVEAMKDRWPTICAYLEGVAHAVNEAKRTKQQQKEARESGEEFWESEVVEISTVASHLQCVESQVMNAGVINDCRGRGIFAIPIHDGCLVRQQDLAYVKASIQRHFSTHTELEATLTVQRL